MSTTPPKRVFAIIRKREEPGLIELRSNIRRVLDVEPRARVATTTLGSND